MTCTECGSNRIELSDGEVVCKDCGFVLDDMPFTEASQGHTSPDFAEAPALAIAGSRPVNGRIYKAHWLLTKRQKNELHGKRIIEETAEQHNLPDIVTTEAKLLLRQALERGIIVGRDVASASLASVYAAAQMHNVPKTSLDLSFGTIVKRSKLLRTHNILRRRLGLALSVTGPEELLPRYASMLGLEERTLERAFSIVAKLRGTPVLSGRRPESIAAAALYVACQETGDRRTQRVIANVVGIIEVTIRKRAKEIQRFS